MSEKLPRRPERSGTRKKALKPAALLSPVPVVLVSCCGLPDGSCNKPNLITIAWTGTVCSKPPMVSISVQPSRHSHQQIKETGEFVVNLVDHSLLQAADYCGVKSGRDVDKFVDCHLTPQAVPALSYAPAVAESHLYLACKVRQIIQLGSHDCFMGEVVSLEAAEQLMDQDNRLCLEKAGLVTYLHGAYHLLGEPVGFFGYSVAAPEVLARRMKSIKQTIKPGTNRHKTGRKGNPRKSSRDTNRQV